MSSLCVINSNDGSDDDSSTTLIFFARESLHYIYREYLNFLEKYSTYLLNSHNIAKILFDICAK